MGEFDYINRTYGLSLRRGTRCAYTGDTGGRPRVGKVSHAEGHYIRVCFDSFPGIAAGPFHPTWEMNYPEMTVTDGSIAHPTPAEASALLRKYARERRLPPNDNNFDDAAAIIERLTAALVEIGSIKVTPSEAIAELALFDALNRAVKLARKVVPISEQSA